MSQNSTDNLELLKPLVIHCCWFGGELSPMAQKCLKSWEKYAPNFKIKRWDKEIEELCNSSLNELPPFVRGAFAGKKWAMLSDWVRMKALYEEGGTYFDFDVELVNDINKLPHDEWIASEWTKLGSWLNPGCGIRLKRGSNVARFMLEEYSKLKFDPSMEMMPWINEKLEKVAYDVKILPPEILSPIDLKGKLHLTSDTVAVHHYEMSWASPLRKFMQWMSWYGLRWVIDLALKVKSFIKGAK